jgi:hypothetical protein
METLLRLEARWDLPRHGVGGASGLGQASHHQPVAAGGAGNRPALELRLRAAGRLRLPIGRGQIPLTAHE